MSGIYLDNNSTTRPTDSVLAVMAETSQLANPASQHADGLRSASQLDSDRERIASQLDCRVRDIYFTSGATEANNLAIVGSWRGRERARNRRNGIVIPSTEHPAVIAAARSLETEGAQVQVIPVNSDGIWDYEQACNLIDDGTFLVSAMLANNETGVINDVARLSDLAHESGALMHTDATQAVGRVGFGFDALGVDLLSLSGHKFHGPRGVGCLIKRSGVEINPLQFGGGQENGLRPGTLNTPAIAGLAEAMVFVPTLLKGMSHTSQLRDQLWAQLHEGIVESTQNGSITDRLPNTLNIRFPGVDSEAILAGLTDVMCSTGSACASGHPGASHVLTAMGMTESEAGECLRFSLSFSTTQEDVISASKAVVSAVRYIRTTMQRDEK